MIVAKIIKKMISKMFWAGKPTGKHLHSTKVAHCYQLFHATAGCACACVCMYMPVWVRVCAVVFVSDPPRRVLLGWAGLLYLDGTVVST